MRLSMRSLGLIGLLVPLQRDPAFHTVNWCGGGSSLGGAIWGALVGFGVWKSQQPKASKREA